jgi:hypothetical protein
MKRVEGLDDGCFLDVESPEVNAPHSPWNICCPVYLFPGIKISEYRKRIKDMYTLAGKTLVQKTYIERTVRDAYGLLHADVLAELFLVARGTLKENLNARVGWNPGQGVKHYWESCFKSFFPALEETLTVNFSSISVVSTHAEIMFSWVENVGHVNSSNSTINKNLAFKGNVSGQIKRHMKATKPLGNKAVVDYDSDNEDDVFNYRTSRRSERSLDEINIFLEQLSIIGRDLEANQKHKQANTFRSLQKKTSKANDKVDHFCHTIADCLANAKKGRNAHNLKDTYKMIYVYNATWVSGVKELPKPEVHPYVAAARSTVWNVEAKRNYLLAKEKEVDPDDIKNARLHIRVTDPDDYKTVNDYIIDYWNRVQPSDEEMQIIIDTYKTKST